MSSHELAPIELKLAADAQPAAIGAGLSARQNLLDLDRELGGRVTGAAPAP